MSPPLVRYFVWRHLLHETRESGVDTSEKHPSLRGISVGGQRKINQIRPGLSEVEIRLLGDEDFIVRSFAEEVVAQLQLRACLLERVLCHATGGESTQDFRVAKPVWQLT